MSKNSSDKNKGLRARPLSPHLTIYKPQISSVLSISHRLTGMFNILGALIIAWFFISIALGPDVYSATVYCLKSKIGTAVLIIWTLTFYYHMLNGIRHLFWDVGLGFGLKTMTASGILVVLGTIALTVATWACIFYQIKGA